jgi:proteasome lid subunit RPN8/RPN11
MRTSPLFSVLELALTEIEELGKLRAPNEACGVLLDTAWRKPNGSPSWVKELPNRSMDGAGTYRVDAEDIRMVLEGLEEVEDVAIWHTHPSGHIGPSRGDMQNRPEPGIYMVVISLTDDGPIATWF